MSPTLDGLFRLFHVLSVGLFGGSLLSMLVVQSLIGRATQDPERRHLANAAARIARHFTGPMILGGWLIGVVYWISKYSFNGAGKLMACTPIFVHTMLLTGTLALGAAQVWQKKTRQLAGELDKGGAWTQNGRNYLRVSWVTASLAFGFLLFTWFVATLRIPNVELRNCTASVEAGISAPGSEVGPHFVPGAVPQSEAMTSLHASV